MTPEQKIIVEWDRLLDPKDMAGQIESYRLVTDVAMHIIFEEGIRQQKSGKSMSAEQRDANNLFQMTALKCLSVLRLVEQKLYHKNGISGRTFTVYDPFGLQPIVRAQFEAYGHFNNVFLNNKSADELKLKLDVWVLCGLKNRQKFDAIQAENAAKKAQEAKDIVDLENAIKKNPVYQGLDQKAQQRIFEMADRSDWKLTISGNNSIFVGWQQLTENAGVKPQFFKSMYRSFSLGAHPSYVSVFQFREAYEPGKEHADFSTLMALKISKFYMSCFIADYCKYSPEAMDIFNKMPELHQLLLNSYNRMVRGDQHSINTIWEDKYGTVLESIVKGQWVPAEPKMRVKFDHTQKKATFSLVDAADGVTVLHDQNKQKLEGLEFPYGHLEAYPELFTKIDGDGVIDFYFFEDKAEG